jgi:hypothetical protein
MRLFPVTCQVIFLYIEFFQTNWIRKESMIAFSLAKIPLTAEKLLKFMFQLNNKWSKDLVLGTGQKSLLLYPMESI